MSENNFLANLRTRKSALEALLKQKVDRFNLINAERESLQNELLDINGKLSMVKELLQEGEKSGKIAPKAEVTVVKEDEKTDEMKVAESK